MKVCEYWQRQFAEECTQLSSLKNFDPSRASLLVPHPIWRLTGNCSYEVNKSIIAAKILSGRYQTEALSRHWSGNIGGYCAMSTCDKVVGDLEHLLLACPALEETRARLFSIWNQRLRHIPPLLSLFLSFINGPANEFIPFLLNPSSNSQILALTQVFGSSIMENAMYFSRTFLYNIHKEKLKLMGKWIK